MISLDFNLKSSYFNLNSFYFNLRVKRCRKAVGRRNLRPFFRLLGSNLLTESLVQYQGSWFMANAE